MRWVACRHAATLAVVTMTAGCAWLPRAATVPMPSLELTTRANGSDPLVVFLPGRFDRPDRFRDERFAEVLARRLPEATAVAADAHLGYYLDGSVVERLHEDVVRPLRSRTGSRVHLVGISMGGLGALVYAQAHPEDVARVVVLAPYLGEDEVIGEIMAAGGLATWRPPRQSDPDDFQRDIWTWLKGYAEPNADRPPLVVGWGSDDDLAPASQLLAEVLPPDVVFTAPGGHDWPTWRSLWSRIVDSGMLDPGPVTEEGK